MTEVKMCALCKEKPAMSDDPPIVCTECFLVFVRTFNAVQATRLAQESDDTNTGDADA